MHARIGGQGISVWTRSQAWNRASLAGSRIASKWMACRCLFVRTCYRASKKKLLGDPLGFLGATGTAPCHEGAGVVLLLCRQKGKSVLPDVICDCHATANGRLKFCLTCEKNRWEQHIIDMLFP